LADLFEMENYGQYVCYFWILSNGTSFKEHLLVTLLHLDVISFSMTSIGNYTGHHKSLQGLEASLEVFCNTVLSNSVVFCMKFTYVNSTQVG